MSKTRKQTGRTPGKQTEKLNPTERAPTVAQSAELRHLEESERNLNFIVKKYEVDGPDAALEALRALQRDGFDPSDHSQQADVSVRLVDDWIEHAETFTGRKPGALAPETVFLEKLLQNVPHEDTRGLWKVLHTIVGNPDDRRNPTPGTCPFTCSYDARGKPVIQKRAKPYPYGTFRNALSAIRRRAGKQ